MNRALGGFKIYLLNFRFHVLFSALSFCMSSVSGSLRSVASCWGSLIQLLSLASPSLLESAYLDDKKCWLLDNYKCLINLMFDFFRGCHSVGMHEWSILFSYSLTLWWYFFCKAGFLKWSTDVDLYVFCLLYTICQLILNFDRTILWSLCVLKVFRDFA